jgi:hypothetical protein
LASPAAFRCRIHGALPGPGQGPGRSPSRIALRRPAAHRTDALSLDPARYLELTGAVRGQDLCPPAQAVRERAGVAWLATWRCSATRRRAVAVGVDLQRDRDPGMAENLHRILLQHGVEVTVS